MENVLEKLKIKLKISLFFASDYLENFSLTKLQEFSVFLGETEVATFCWWIVFHPLKKQYCMYLFNFMGILGILCLLEGLLDVF